MKRLSLALGLSLLAAPALAQQQPPDPATLQRALGALQTQRNQAFDLAASWEARAGGLADELTKANARLKELEPKPADKPKE